MNVSLFRWFAKLFATHAHTYTHMHRYSRAHLHVPLSVWVCYFYQLQLLAACNHTELTSDSRSCRRYTEYVPHLQQSTRNCERVQHLVFMATCGIGNMHVCSVKYICYCYCCFELNFRGSLIQWAPANGFSYALWRSLCATPRFVGFLSFFLCRRCHPSCHFSY